MARELIRLDEVHRAFGPLTVLEGVNLRIDEGDRIGVIGHNGAGKTTWFNLISGQLAASAGSVHLFDQDITALGAAARTARLPAGRAASTAVPSRSALCSKTSRWATFMRDGRRR